MRKVDCREELHNVFGEFVKLIYLLSFKRAERLNFYITARNMPVIK